MASTTVNQTPFPSGASVSIYTRDGSRAPLDTPVVPGQTLVATVTAGSGGALALSGLTEARKYWAVGQDSAGAWRWVAFRVDAEIEGASVGDRRRLEQLEAAGALGAPRINTAQIFQSESGADASLATDWHGLFNFPNKTGISTIADYADSSTASTTIYQLAGGVYNSGSRPAVAVAGFARGKLVWGMNIVAMADGVGSIATGLEVDIQLVTTGLGVANGVEIHAHGAAGNPGHYLGMTARAGLEDPSPRVGIQISVNGGTDQPLQAAGTIFETSGAIQTTYGLDWKTAAFSGAAAWLPVNRGSAGASIGIKLECRGGNANTGSMMQFSAADGSSTATYAIRVATASGGPVSASGTIIYVDGGTFGKFIDIAAATFAASGAIVMGDNNISFGTTTGGKIGTSTTQKIGFFNKTPVVQQTGGALTAAATYGANEQTMLQRVYDAVRNIGIMA